MSKSTDGRGVLGICEGLGLEALLQVSEGGGVGC
jgi:hypothetical protein